MKLSPAQVEKLSQAVLDRLTKRSLLSSSAGGESILSRIKTIILNELQVEDRLDEEVRTILEAHRKEIDEGRVDYNKMFQMIKKKLVQERNIIL